MRINKKAGLAAGVLAGVTMLIAPAAFATNTGSVDGTTSPVGNVAVTGTNVGTLSMLTNATPGVPASCANSSISGTVVRGGSVTVGSTIGSISNMVFGTAGTPCTATTLNYPVIISKNTNVGSTDWPIVVTATPAKGAATVPIRIDNVDVKMQSTSKTGSPTPSYICDLRAKGTVTGTFNQNTQQISINPPTGTYPINNITAYDGNGTKTTTTGKTCAGQVWTGDGARLVGTFTVSTPLGGGLHW